MILGPEKTYKIQKLDSQSNTLDFARVHKLLLQTEILELLSTVQESYVSWDEFRNKNLPAEDRENLWRLIQSNRTFAQKPTPIVDKDGGKYAFDPRRNVEFLHQVDLELGGNMLGISDFGAGDKRQIIRRNLIEESIASSKLEGANTSREAARRMLNEGRSPRDKSERMIVNNHRAMLQIEESLKNEPMSFDLLMELHKQVTNGTLRDPKLEGRLRDTFDEDGNRLKIMPWDETTVAYVAPDREFVETHLPRLIKFANDEDSSGFVHPLHKAIMLHFWVGLLHPFEDGNGRLARIIFYWYMLRKGYWAFSYLSLSERILKSPTQYAMAYIYAEQDGYDLNYFIQYNVEKLKLARQNLQEYLKRKIAENRHRNRLLESGYGFNARQLLLLQYLSKDEERRTSVSEYHNVNSGIGYVTAVSDLKSLVEKGMLRKIKIGRNVSYLPTSKVPKLFR